MDLVHDYIHPTPRGGRCRIRLYLTDKRSREVASGRYGSGHRTGRCGTALPWKPSLDRASVDTVILMH